MDCTLLFGTFSFSIPQHVDSMSSVAQACIGINLLCLKLFFSMSKFYLYMYMLQVEFDFRSK